jgi:ribose transport system substrate-binding protein
MKKFFLLTCLLIMFLVMTIGAITEGQEKITIGFATRELTAPFSQAMVLAAQNKAKELGIELIVLSSDNDSLRHLDIMDNFITMGIDGFICGGVIDTKAIVSGITKMNEANIPVVALDNSPEGGKIDYFISNDIKDASKKATEYMVQELKDRNEGKVPTGIIIEVLGDLTSSFAGECTAGFHSVIDEYKEFKIVQGTANWSNDESFKLVADYLTRFGKEVIGVYVHTPDVMGTGAINAVKQAGIDPKKIVSAGFCLGPEGVDLIKKGEFTAIGEQQIYTAGEMAVELLYKMIKGEPVPKIGDVLIEEGALWSPAEVVKNSLAEGAFIKLSTPMVPQDVSPDDPRLWENMLFK